MAVPSPSFLRERGVIGKKSDLRVRLRQARADFVKSLSSNRHSREGGGPGPHSQSSHAREGGDWIPAFAGMTIEEAESALADHVQPLLSPDAVLASYAPVGAEISPAQIEAAHDGPVLLPWHASRNAEMQFCPMTSRTVSGPWGVPQPATCNAFQRPDIVLVPLVGATPRGDRLGQGQGHFDRALAALRGGGPLICIGLAWDCQIVEDLPTDHWDETLDFVTTPSRLYRCR